MKNIEITTFGGEHLKSTNAENGSVASATVRPASAMSSRAAAGPMGSRSTAAVNVGALRVYD